MDASSTGAGTINSTGLLTVTQAGTIVIDANQAGGLVNNVYYENAPQVQLTLTFNPAAQTIVFPAPGGAPFTYSPTLTVALSANGGASGNAVQFTVDPSSTGGGTISASTLSNGTSSATLTVTTAGSITINANQTATANYAAATQVQQTFTVNQASQTISIVPPSQPIHFVTGGTLQIAVSATGGGSNNAVTFTVDGASPIAGSFSATTLNGSTSTAILTVTQPSNLTVQSTILIDADQAGTSNYAAATQAEETITLMPALPVQTITWSNPGTQVTGTPLTLTGTASSGFPVLYTSNTTSVCTVNSTTSTATFLTAGTCTVVATQPGDNIYYAAAPPVTQTFTVNPTGHVPAMLLNLSLTTLTIQSGTVGTSNITVTSQNNFTGSIVFTCTGLPTGYGCSFNPAGSGSHPLVVGQGTAATTTLSVGPSSTAALQQNPRPFAPMATLAVALCLIGFRKRIRIFLLVLLALSLTSLSLFTGCGGASTTVKAPTTSTATLTATAGKTTTSASFTVIID